MKTIEREGKSTSSIISGFMKEHNLQLEDFKFEVVDAGKKGFLGIFSTKPTRVRFTMPDQNDTISEMTRAFLQRIGIEFDNIRTTENNDNYQVDILGVKEAGFIIGKEARILDAFQHLLTQMVSKKERRQLKIDIDVDGYRERKNDQLREKLEIVTERIKKTGRSYTFEPMLAPRRKIIHQFVENDPKLQTMTIGKGDSKRVVISVAGKKPLPQPANKSHIHPHKHVPKDKK
ncbi:MAG: Jag N-terminal domain-containing protein [Candidatus Cloacimonetes bacterium]|nr:Jag N-terminal domain-containing protein [Candidatus Cloacimonadota bacterium]